MTDDPDKLTAVPVKTGSTRRRKPVSIDRAVEEGLLIARAALTMGVKNDIIIRAIRDGEPYDAGYVAAVVKRELATLEQQNDDSASRLRQLAVDVLSRKGARGDGEGYRAADNPALSDRAIIHERLSVELERLSEDKRYLKEVAETARAEAWSEVGDAIESRLLKNVPLIPDRFYEDDKDARIRALYNINLRALERQAKKRGHRR
jgi:hypothetical protein